MAREFKPGDKVLVLGGWRGEGLIRKSVVKKFYKNGNFVLEDDGQQYCKQGYQTGPHSYNKFRVIHADTDKALGILREHRVESLVSQITDEVNAMRDASEDVIALMEQALALLRSRNRTKEI